MQVGEKERDHDLSSMRKEIATIVAEKCVDPTTQTPYPIGIIEKAMAEAGFSVKPNKTAKSQVEFVSYLANALNYIHRLGIGVHQTIAIEFQATNSKGSDARQGLCTCRRY